MPGNGRNGFHVIQVVILKVLLGVLLGLAPGIGWVAVGAAADADLSRQFQLASGLKLTIWASEPQLANPVAFTFDEKGRAYVAESHRWARSIFDITKQLSWLETDLSFRTVKDRSEFLTRTYATNLAELTADSERISWVEDRDGDGRAELAGLFAEGGFNLPTSGTAAGVLARTGTVWFASIPELWRLEGNKEGLRETSRKALHTGFGVHIGVSGHDLHGLTWGPDGRIYFSIGDRGFHVEGAPEISPAKSVEDGWKFSFHQPDCGGVLRCDPDGSNLEVVAIGLRNPQELTFDDFGNLWTGDNDTAGADDSRFLFVVEGGDYGWRTGYQHLPGFGTWVGEGLWRGGMDDVLPTSGLVSQGPAGLAFNPGASLGAAWANTFFMCDFPGAIWSFKVIPKGAGYEVVNRQKFMANLWPTDIEFGVDGAVYVADWVFGWGQPGKGRIYRIAPVTAGTVEAEMQGEIRRMLGGDWPGVPVDELERRLAHGDLRIRREAQWALVRKGVEGFQALARQAERGGNLHARIHGIWGLAQLGRQPGVESSIREGVEVQLLGRVTDEDAEVRAQALRMVGELRIHQAREKVWSRLNDVSPRVRLFAGIAAGRLGGLTNLAPILQMVRGESGADPFVRHGALMALLGSADAGAITRLLKDRDASVRKLAVLGLRRLQRPEISQAFSDFDPEVVSMVARAVYDVPINEAMPALAAFLGKIDCPTNILTRAMYANLRLGEQRNATLLTAFAGRADVAEVHRIQALEALSDWVEPPSVDRVVGLWRPMPSRSAEIARRAFREVASKLDAGRSESVRLAAMRTAAKLRTKEVGHGYLESWTKGTNSVAVRVEILKTLGVLKHSRLGEALTLGLADSDSEVRRAAIQLAAVHPQPEFLGRLKELLVSEKDLRFRQTIYSILGRMEVAEADRLVLEGIQAWLRKDQPLGLGLELIEAARHRNTPELVQALEEVKRQFPEGEALKSWIPATEGGDALRGKSMFLDRADLQCQRCHQVGGAGGTVGPSLDGVGKRLTRLELVESILRPNAKLAVGFEQVQIVMKDGRSVAGLLKREDDRECLVENLEDGAVKLAKADIQQRRRGLSAMPEGFEKLITPAEMRDLVEYLASLK